MSITPLAYADSLRIGIVDFVSPDEIKVQLDIEAPESVALNSGTPRPFPRINGYLLIPSDEGFLVAQVEWITVERSQFPKRKGMQDFGLLDLPFPLRKLSLNPLGTLVTHGKNSAGVETSKFRRGVETFPSVGDSVLLPTQAQLKSIVESGDGRRVKIGVSTLAGNAEVMIDPNRLFGRHLAVLGNTGSGKSCSVAGLIRWSIDAAKKGHPQGAPNSRFIVLDPNGEYKRAFSDFDGAKFYAIQDGDPANQLKVPLWFWNSSEWCAFTQASAKTQRPTLIQSLRSVRDGLEVAATPIGEMRRFLRTVVSVIQIEENAGSPWASFPRPKNFCEKIRKWAEGGLTPDAVFGPEQTAALEALTSEISSLVSARSGAHPHWDFSRAEITELLLLAKDAHAKFGGGAHDALPIDADTPRAFTGEAIINSINANAEMLNVSEYVETMLIRVRALLTDTRMKSIIGDGEGLTLADWLENHIGSENPTGAKITVIDLSMVPAEVVSVITAVIARMTFEALQRYRRMHPEHKTLPTVLVMEEAHTFIKRYKEDSENHDASAVCCQLFEKIAREGRKFGLGLVLSSQRPSELSPTVLSQCNTFLLHRISNDRDQELVHRLVPDNLKGLLRDLPSLPSQNAILLGWASELPVLVRMNDLPEHQRPQSDDPDFWEVWTGTGHDAAGKSSPVSRNVDWQKIADDWQQIPEPAPQTPVPPATNGGEAIAAVVNLQVNAPPAQPAVADDLDEDVPF